ncbi:hypothetical protein OSSY52_06860 [Tepiditoga spiralis]|uniref:Uncharacterized protein n=1 Tax=Tepiditoga spiralis TaxID=2108365 RepID=A0A7G1G3F7_9BACT|nr:hypothetical protein [Tepiditoga spiralis]BBE30545.1 hypothetical protein OSSY52_06860 [Tepiditoga spiralis]
MKKNFLEIVVFYLISFLIIYTAFNTIKTDEIILKTNVKNSESIKKTTNYEYVGKETAVISGGYSGIYLFSLKDNKIIKQINTGNYVNSIKIIGSTLYLTDKDGLKIYNINKNSITLLNEYNTFGDALSLLVDKNQIYVGDGKNGIVVFELKPGGFLRLKKHIKINGIVTSMTKYKNNLFVVGPKIGIKIFNEKFNEVGSFTKLFSPIQILANDGKLYLLDRFLGFYTFNIESFFENKVEFKAISYSINSFAFYNNIIYFAASDGIYTLDNKMKKIISGDFSNTKIKIFDDYMYLTRYDKGLQIYDLNTLKLIEQYNKMDSVYLLKGINDLFFAVDDKKIYYMDKNFNILKKEELNGKIIKTNKNIFLLNDDKIIDLYNKKTYEVSALNILDLNETYYVNKEGAFKLKDNSKVLENLVSNILLINKKYYYVKNKKIYLNNKIMYESNKRIIESFYNEGIYILTEDGIDELNLQFKIEKSYNTETKVDKILFSKDKIFISIQDKLIVLNKELKKIKEINFKLPISDIEYYNNKVYISLLYEGIYIYDSDFKMIKKVDTFNAIDIETF